MLCVYANTYPLEDDKRSLNLYSINLFGINTRGVSSLSTRIHIQNVNIYLICFSTLNVFRFNSQCKTIYIIFK
jgi:hypothetical protein